MKAGTAALLSCTESPGMALDCVTYFLFTIPGKHFLFALLYLALCSGGWALP